MTSPGPPQPAAPRSASQPARRLAISIALLVAVAWQWVRAGGPPPIFGLRPVGVLWSALVVCLAARQAARGPAARQALSWLLLGLAVALCLVQVWLVSLRRAPAWTLLPYALLLGFWLWLVLAVRRARRQHGTRA